MWSVDERMRVRRRHWKSEALGQLAGPQVMVGALGVLLDLSALKSEPAPRRQGLIPAFLGELTWAHGRKQLLVSIMHDA